MVIHELFLFLFLILPNALSTSACSNSSCGDIQIKYPFKLQSQETGNNCTYVNLTCTNQGTPILHLPSSGDFTVSYIDYYGFNKIHINDPGNCLLGRLLNNSINLSSTPFTAPYFENYTFYTCPANALLLGYYALPIGCLSNSTNATVATSDLSAEKEFEYYGCKIIGSSLIPILYEGQFMFAGINDDLILAWNVTDCKDCDAQSPQDNGKSRLGNFLTNPPIMFLMALLFLSCCAGLTMMMRGRNGENTTANDNSTNAAALPQPSMQTIITGLDDSNIKSYTELVAVGENHSSSRLGNSSCAICLEAYNPKEKVRCIVTCEHFFHDTCILLWFKRNDTCPVCRTSLSDVKV